MEAGDFLECAKNKGLDLLEALERPILGKAGQSKAGMNQCSVGEKLNEIALDIRMRKVLPTLPYAYDEG